MAEPGVVVFTLERNSPGLYRLCSSATSVRLEQWFPPWTVTRAAWCAALKLNVSGITTDVVLFSQHGPGWSTHYRVYGEYVSHSSLRGTFMAKLSEFTNRACAQARWVVKVVGTRVVRFVAKSSGTVAARAYSPHARPRPSGPESCMDCVVW